MQRMNKRGDIEFDIILKLLLGLIILIIIIGLIFIFKGKSLTILDKVKEIMRFG